MSDDIQHFLNSKYTLEFEKGLEQMYVDSLRQHWLREVRQNCSIWVFGPIIGAILAHLYDKHLFVNIELYAAGTSLAGVAYIAFSFTKIFKKYFEVINASASMFLQIFLVFLLLGNSNDQMINGGVPLFFIILFADMVLLPGRHKTRVIMSVLKSFVIFGALYERGVYPTFFGGPIIFFSYIIGIIFIGYRMSVRFEKLSRSQFLLKQDISAKKDQSDNVLNNVLPAEISERLKTEDHRNIAQYHPKAVVLFADLSGFTAWAALHDARDVVSTLDHIFGSFDRVSQKHNVQKLKTIGDSYMAVAGVIDGSSDSHLRMGQFALDIRVQFDVVKQKYNLPMSLRIGIHSGPVVSGVIGEKMFSFDVWGTTVNIASRLESVAEIGTICVSEEFCRDAKGFFEFSGPHTKEVKGLGERLVYALEGVSSTLKQSA